MQKVEQDNGHMFFNHQYYLLLTEDTHRHDKYLNFKWVILLNIIVIANHVLIL